MLRRSFGQAALAAATLPLPALLLDALQVNMRGGRLSEPEANGVSYLKIPLNRFQETGCETIRHPRS